MSDKSKIEWTDATWNPIRGCSRVSEGCRNCYAEKIAARFSGPGQPYEWVATPFAQLHPVNNPLLKAGHWTGEVRFIPELLEQPLHWRRPRRVFVNSMSDLFHEKVKSEWLKDIFDVMTRCRQHTFQILTKRPEQMRTWMLAVYSGRLKVDPPENIWLGVSVEDQKTANERIPLLLKTPAAVRWVSYEPALGPVDFTRIYYETIKYDQLGPVEHYWHGLIDSDSHPPIDWIVAGGESGPAARPAHPDWFRIIRDQCQALRVPLFFKQWGGRTPKTGGRLLDGREWNEFPAENHG